MESDGKTKPSGLNTASEKQIDAEGQIVTVTENQLHRDLKGRHMQMIAMYDTLMSRS